MLPLKEGAPEELRNVGVEHAAVIVSILAIVLSTVTYLRSERLVTLDYERQQRTEFLSLIQQLNEREASLFAAGYTYKDSDEVGQIQQSMLREMLVILQRVDQLLPDVTRTYRLLPAQKLILAKAYADQGITAVSDRWACAIDQKSGASTRAGALIVLAHNQYATGSIARGRKLYEEALSTIDTDKSVHATSRTANQFQAILIWFQDEYSLGDETGAAAKELISRAQALIPKLARGSIAESGAKMIGQLNKEIAKLSDPM